MDYYQKKLFLARVDKNDNIIGKVERWQAHKEKILHRGFTTIIKIDNHYLLQKRKHPVFDGVFDLSFSSHPIFINERLETIEKAIINSFKREWITYEKKPKLVVLDKYYYWEKDKNSDYSEHEINYLYLLTIKDKKIKNNPLYSYQMEVLTSKEIIAQISKINFAPWIKKLDLNRIFIKIEKI